VTAPGYIHKDGTPYSQLGDKRTLAGGGAIAGRADELIATIWFDGAVMHERLLA
jgi:hypothetical protein